MCSFHISGLDHAADQCSADFFAILCAKLFTAVHQAAVFALILFQESDISAPLVAKTEIIPDNDHFCAQCLQKHFSYKSVRQHVGRFLRKRKLNQYIHTERTDQTQSLIMGVDQILSGMFQ